MKSSFLGLGAFAVLAAGGLVTGCTQETPAAAPAAATGCTDTEKLPGTGLCPAQAMALLDPVSLQPADGLPDGCSWTVNDTMMGGESEALLYQAMRCKDKTTRLEMRAGAHSATLGYEVSGFYDTLPDDFEPVRIFTTEGQADPKATILAMAKETTTDKTEAAACEIKLFTQPTLPADADGFVIDVSEAYSRQNPLPAVAEGDRPEVRPACGPYGATDGVRYWFIRQGYAWLVDFGQDTPDFNPDSIVRIARGADGVWARLP